MALIVQKFGGTSVGTPKRILSVAERIAGTRAGGDDVVVVVSAMGHTTDELIALAHQVTKNPPHREMDMLLSVGERVSMSLLSMALADLKIPALSLTGSQSGIITDSGHRRAKIRTITGKRIKDALSSGKVAIVAGFQGVSEEKEITTLGRGGSDTTAVALAAALGASVCDIYTDVDGVYSADPRVVPNAKLWKKIPASLMLEMSIRGAGVLHSRCVELAAHYQVNLRVRNSLKDDKGTQVIVSNTHLNDNKGMEEYAITGVTADRGKMPIVIQMTRPTVVGAIWDFAAMGNLLILAPNFADSVLRFFIEKDALGEWTKGLSDLAHQGFIKEFHAEKELVPLSIIGSRFAQDGAALSKVLDLLAQNHILVTMGTASALSMTFAVKDSAADDAVRALHKEFLERSLGD
ncbi:MAG: aspartate kinase [Bdellovibrionota bacterium]